MFTDVSLDQLFERQSNDPLPRVQREFPVSSAM